MIYSRRNVEFREFWQRNTTLWVWLWISLWKLALFLQNKSQSIAFVEIYKQNKSTSLFLWEILIYSRRNFDFYAFRQRTGYFNYDWWYLLENSCYSFKTTPNRLNSLNSRSRIQEHVSFCGKFWFILEETSIF